MEVDVDWEGSGGREGGGTVAAGLDGGGVASWDGECLDGDLGGEVCLLVRYGDG